MPRKIKQFRPPSNKPPRPNSAARGYCSAAWRRTRLVVIARDMSQCQWPGCGKVVFGNDCHIDHIVEKAVGGDDALSNLRVLCQSHHSQRHAGSGLF